VPTTALNRRTRSQQSITLHSLETEKKLKAEKVNDFSKLKGAVKRAAGKR